jgi:hypothetical protein
VIAPTKTTHGNGWLCRCECGTERIIYGAKLRSGRTRSCGCARWDANYHPQASHLEAQYSRVARLTEWPTPMLPTLPCGSRLIPLDDSKNAIVDPVDFERLSRFRWTATRSDSGIYYAVRSDRGCVWMHRQILQHRYPETDHIDGDGLNNRRRNLRPASTRDNQRNMRNSKNQKLGGFKGVSWRTRDQGWRAQIRIPDATGVSKTVWLGMFDDPFDAARAYDAAARDHFGEFAALNFPDLIVSVG